MKRLCLAFAAILAVIMAPSFAKATDQTDLIVALKTFPLLSNKLSSPVVAAIVYDSSSPESKSDADAIKSLFDGGLEGPGGIKLSTTLVSTGELTKLSGVKVAFLAKGTPSSNYASFAAAVNNTGALSISTDLDCAKAGKCVLGVASKPSVEIYFSSTAADGAKISFAQAFTMLAKPI